MVHLHWKKGLIPWVILSENWRKEYSDLLNKLHKAISSDAYNDFNIEVISHRFTSRARSNILEVFPNTGLPMNEEIDRSYKYGQFGYGKFVYTKELLAEMKEFLSNKINNDFPGIEIEYII